MVILALYTRGGIHGEKKRKVPFPAYSTQGAAVRGVRHSQGTHALALYVFLSGTRFCFSQE
jgi:hypothetical protein